MVGGRVGGEVVYLWIRLISLSRALDRCTTPLHVSPMTFQVCGQKAQTKGKEISNMCYFCWKRGIDVDWPILSIPEPRACHGTKQVSTRRRAVPTSNAGGIHNVRGRHRICSPTMSTKFDFFQEKRPWPENVSQLRCTIVRTPKALFLTSFHIKNNNPIV